MTLPASQTSQSAVVIGGGPAGLMAAEVLSQHGVPVDVYDAMPSLGRKFLLAGVGGMNITHAEPFAAFLRRYENRAAQIEPLLRAFDAEALRQWVQGLGIDTFVGSSGRVFPAEMKAAPLLRAWLKRLRGQGVRFHSRHRWLGWTVNQELHFRSPDTEHSVTPLVVVLALGGGSWARLGSDGAWVPLLQQRGIDVAPLQPANCGFDVQGEQAAGWSEHFQSRFAGQPVKPVVMSLRDAAGCEHRQQGEFIVTASGVEGGLIYALAAPLRDTLEATGEATFRLDLVPGRSEQQLAEALGRPHGKASMASQLRKRAGIEGVKAGLLRELVPAGDFQDPRRLAVWIKSLPVKLRAARPLDEAISSAGGVRFADVDEHLMLHAMPGVFCAGEMLDWEAPTGGYLLTACFASGHAAGQGAVAWLKNKGAIT